MACSGKYELILSTGGNLGDRLENLQLSADYINKEVGEIIAISNAYISEPWGFEDKKYFLNQIIKLETKLDIDIAFQKLQEIEKLLGRTEKTTEHYQGRTVDIDIIDAAGVIINLKDLQLPHKEMHNRLFVLHPLHDICPNWIHPVFKKAVGELIRECKDKSRIKKLKYAAIRR